MNHLNKKLTKKLDPIKYSDELIINSQCYISDMPADAYHSHSGSVSNSQLKLVSRSPAHFKYAAEKSETRNKVLGSALHMACLEPDLFYNTYILLRNSKDRTTSEYKEAKKEHGEEKVLVAPEVTKVEGIMDALYKNTEIRGFLELPGYNELSGFSIDPDTGVTCRHRFDKLTKTGIAIDLKTTIDARKSAFSRSIFTYGYHIQNAFYWDQFYWITGDILQDFIFIAIESETPYASKIYRVDNDSMLIGRDAYRKALNTYAYCLDMDEWPAYDETGIEEISIPEWALKQHDNSLIESFQFTE